MNSPMSFEWVPYLLFGILLIFVSRRVQGTAPLFGLARLTFLITALILIGWAIFAGWSEITASL